MLADQGHETHLVNKKMFPGEIMKASKSTFKTGRLEVIFPYDWYHPQNYQHINVSEPKVDHHACLNASLNTVSMCGVCMYCICVCVYAPVCAEASSGH